MVKSLLNAPVPGMTIKKQQMTYIILIKLTFFPLSNGSATGNLALVGPVVSENLRILSKVQVGCF